MPSFSGITFSEGEKIDLVVCGIHVHVVTDATLSWLDTDGVEHIGTIKTKFNMARAEEIARMIASRGDLAA